MKTQGKNSAFHLQKDNKCWKWMAGATAATAAGVTTSAASLITVNLNDNYISGLQGNHLNADLTGDGHPDLTIANAYNAFSRAYVFNSYQYVSWAGVRLNGVPAGVRSIWSGFDYGFGSLALGSRFLQLYHGYYGSSYQSRSLTGSIPIFFKDLRINGGAPTTGLLEVTVAPSSGVQLDSFTYTSNTPVGALNVATVPDGGSSLALLAMGASGILALRKLRAEAKRVAGNQ